MMRVHVVREGDAWECKCGRAPKLAEALRFPGRSDLWFLTYFTSNTPPFGTLSGIAES